MMAQLTYITKDLPGVGGKLRSLPTDFVVEEIPLYDPSGQGQHIYVRLTREGRTTREIQEGLAELFGLREADVGVAGLKDKHARATQVISLWLPTFDETAVKDLIEGNLPVEIVWVRRHRNKLRKGHLIGNRFRIIVRGPEPQSLDRARAIANALKKRGLPNYYGEQRFGLTGTNAQKGFEVLHGRGPRARWLRRFLLAAFQAELFNCWLTERIEQDWFSVLLLGDIAKKVDTGGLFEVKDVESELPRFQRREITYTGPVYGWRMRWASGEPGHLERGILDQAQVTSKMMRRVRLGGSRRPGRLFVDDLEVKRHAEGLLFSFTLPKAAYATTLLREFQKADLPSSVVPVSPGVPPETH
jgi:tRNA pseudouridine13 synthase